MRRPAKVQTQQPAAKAEPLNMCLSHAAAGRHQAGITRCFKQAHTAAAYSRTLHPTKYLLPPNETSDAKNGLHLNKSLAQRAPWKSQTTKATDCSLQTASKALFLKTTPMHNSLNTEKSNWCLPRAFTLLTSVHGTGRHSAHYQRRKMSGKEHVESCEENVPLRTAIKSQ
ncbi:hypothetical protein STEG23_023726 [Scotinomys teguina]